MYYLKRKYAMHAWSSGNKKQHTNGFNHFLFCFLEQTLSLL